MTKPEKLWAWLLQEEKNKGLINDFYFEQVTLYLSDPQKGVKRVSFTPDFFVIMADGTVRIDEVKGGFIREDADMKFKIAASRFPWVWWRMVQYKKRGKTTGFETIRELGRIHGHSALINGGKA